MQLKNLIIWAIGTSKVLGHADKTSSEHGPFSASAEISIKLKEGSYSATMETPGKNESFKFDELWVPQCPDNMVVVSAKVFMNVTMGKGNLSVVDFGGQKSSHILDFNRSEKRMWTSRRDYLGPSKEGNIIGASCLDKEPSESKPPQVSQTSGPGNIPPVSSGDLTFAQTRPGGAEHLENTPPVNEASILPPGPLQNTKTAESPTSTKVKGPLSTESESPSITQPISPQTLIASAPSDKNSNANANYMCFCTPI